MKAKFSQEVFPTKGKYGIHLNPGQLITSIGLIAEWSSWVEWGVEKRPNKKIVKDVLTWLESNDMITVESNATGTFINITNWGTYNNIEDKKVTEINQQEVTEKKRLVDTIKELRELLEQKNKPKKITTLSDKPDLKEDVCQKIFEYWKQVHNHPRSKLDAKRRKLVSDRLKDGYSEADLMAAIDGCKMSPHHQGENDRRTVYDDLELICRDGKHVDMFIKIASTGKEAKWM